jgi:hypothetical protein
MSRRMPFGKFRGEPLEGLPLDYLQWLRSIELREPLRTAVEVELLRRQANRGAPAAPLCLPAPVQAAAVELIASGFRAAARRRHPDTGGSHQAMIELAAARDALAAVLGAA